MSRGAGSRPAGAAAIGYQRGKDTGRCSKEWMAKHDGLADGKLVQDARTTLG